MALVKRIRRGIAASVIAACAAAPAAATTLIRASIDDLVASNSTVVVGDVVDASSRWNADGTFMLTDVHVVVHDVLKGRKDLTDLKLTLMGGSIGDLTTLIVAGAELVPGRSYVLFVADADLPGTPNVATMPDHCQGAFDIVAAPDGVRAISQGNGHPLLPDKLGHADAPGGPEGFPLAALIDSIRARTAHPQGRRDEVNP